MQQQSNDLTGLSSSSPLHFKKSENSPFLPNIPRDAFNHEASQNLELYDSMTPSNFNGMLSPLNFGNNEASAAGFGVSLEEAPHDPPDHLFSHSYTQQQLKYQINSVKAQQEGAFSPYRQQAHIHKLSDLEGSLSLSGNQSIIGGMNGMTNVASSGFGSSYQQQNNQLTQLNSNAPSQNGTAHKKLRIIRAEQINMGMPLPFKQQSTQIFSNDQNRFSNISGGNNSNNNGKAHNKSFSSHQLEHSLSSSTQPFSSPKKKFSSNISNSSNNNQQVSAQDNQGRGSFPIGNNTPNLSGTNHPNPENPFLLNGIGYSDDQRFSNIIAEESHREETDQGDTQLNREDNPFARKPSSSNANNLKPRDEQESTPSKNNSGFNGQELTSTLKGFQETQQILTTNGAGINYQTASFGKNGKPLEGRLKRLASSENNHKDSEDASKPEKSPTSKPQPSDPMYSTFTDLSIHAASIINPELKVKLQDAQTNWKVRTEAIDEVQILIKQQIQENPVSLLNQVDSIVEFLMNLLTDQNFKIVVTTLNIINELLMLSLMDETALKEKNQPSLQQSITALLIQHSQKLNRFVPLLIKKLGDSKNIIRQEALRALIMIYDIVKKGEELSSNGQNESKNINGLISMILLYLKNSSNWHVREELLNALILLFIKSQSNLEYDAVQLVQSLVTLLNDQKDRVKLLAKEALVSYAYYVNKYNFKELAYQFCDPSQKQELLERFQQENVPFLDEENVLTFPFIDLIEGQAREQMGSALRQQTAEGANNTVILPNLSRRESFSSNAQPPKTLGSGQGQRPDNNSFHRQPSRGNSSGRRIVPPSANSIGNYVSHQNKRTVSAHNIKQDLYQDTYYDQSPAMSHKVESMQYQHNTHFGFLPSLNKVQSQQYSQINNSYYSQNNQNQISPFFVNNSGHPQSSAYMQQLKIQKQMNSDSLVYSANGGARQQHPVYGLGMHQHPTQGQKNHNQQLSLHQQKSFNIQSGIGQVGGAPNLHLHKNVHSAHHAYSQNTSMHNNSLFESKEELYFKNQGFLNQIHANQMLYDASQQATISYNESRMTPLSNGNQQRTNNSSHHPSRLGSYGQVQDTPTSSAQIGSVPGTSGKKAKLNGHHMQGNNQNTFYSEGSFTTTTTSIPDKIRMLRANKRFQANAGALNSGSGVNGGSFQMNTFDHHPKLMKQSVNNQSNGNINNQSVDAQNMSSVTDSKANQSGIASNTRRGPIKAMRHIIHAQNENQADNQNNISQNINQQPSQENLQDLCIDSRKPKKKLSAKKVKPSLQEQQDLEEAKNPSRDSQSKTREGIQARRTNFGQSDYDDNTQKYVPTEELEPLENPEKDLRKAANLMLSSDDWATAFEGCNIVRRLCKHHSSILVQQSGMISGLVGQITKIADSLRSQLTKIALLTLNDMFCYLKRCMEPQLDVLCKIMLKKSTDTNIFINETAEQSLLSMVQNCQDTKVLQILLTSNVNAKANVYRQKICKCLSSLVKVLGNSILFFKENDKLLSQLANYLSDACPDVRNIAKQSFLELSQAIMDTNDREKLLQRVLNEVQLKKVKDLLDKEPAYFSGSHQNNQQDFVIINANSQFQQNKKNVPQKPPHQSSKGQLRSASLNKSNIQSNDDQPLNIQATKIIKPSQIKKRISQEDVSSLTLNSGQIKPTPLKKNAQLDQFFLESLKEHVLQTQISDWKTKLDSVNSLYDYIDQNSSIFQTKASTKFVELSDTLSALMSDQNAKIQQLALDRFLQIMPKISFFVETYLTTLYQALTSNLASSNTSVKKMTEQILSQLNEQIKDKSILANSLLSSIQFSANARLKPLLIDQLSDMIPQINESGRQQFIQKTVVPIAIKLLEDNRAEVKSKTERLMRNLYQVLGQSMIDNCPQPKLQRLCDIVMQGGALNNSGIATFGAQSINGLLKQANLQ